MHGRVRDDIPARRSTHVPVLSTRRRSVGEAAHAAPVLLARTVEVARDESVGPVDASSRALTRLMRRRIVTTLIATLTSRLLEAAPVADLVHVQPRGFTCPFARHNMQVTP
jgi:hypothetical protein